MARPLLFAPAVLLLAQACQAQEAPEDLLPTGTQVYLRWDGVDAHRAAYAQTAVGRMMAGDTGKFLAGLVTLIQDNLGAVITVEQLLKGTSPGRLMKLQTDAAKAPQLFGQFTKHGFILAAEIAQLEPFEARLTLVIPDAGAEPQPLFGLVGLSGGLAGAEAKDEKVEGRSVRHWEQEGVHVACWAAGKHLVLTVGTDAPAAAVQRAAAKDARLTSHPLFRRVMGFSDFENAARAFIDVEALVRRANERGREVGKLVTDLGLEGVKSVVLYSGFDGDSDRGLIEADLAGERKGLVKLLDGTPLTLSDAPPLPHDVTSWSMTRFEAESFYDLALLTIENVVRVFSEEDLPKVRELSKQADELLDVDLRNELLGALGDRFAVYSSPADGPLNLGQVFLWRVKDEKQLKGALNKAIKGLGRLGGTDLSIAKKDYRGAELREVSIRQQGVFFVPTYTVYKGWLVVSYFPQPVQGFVRRANGELPSWKPDDRTRAAFDRLPREFVSASYMDPRPTIRHFLTVGPLIAGAVRSFMPDLKLDVGSVPNSHEATRHLFPNVSVASLRDGSLRVDSRSSLDLPVDLSGIDTFAILGLLGLAQFLF
jgi:hypothetical protein